MNRAQVARKAVELKTTIHEIDAVLKSLGDRGHLPRKKRRKLKNQKESRRRNR